MPEEARHAASGVFSPVVTPFKADLSPDPDRFLAHCRWLVGTGVGLAVFGTNSEANSLSVAERKALLEHLLDNGIDPLRMMPGTGCCSIPETVELTAHAVTAGVAGVLMLPPFYYKGVSQEGLFRYFAEVIERVGDDRLRIYLYHIPPVAQVPIPIALIERLLTAYPNTVAGIKDSSGDWSNTQAMLDRFPGFGIFAGSEEFLLATLRGGGAGCISATANINGPAIVRLFDGWQGPDADRLQAECTAFRKAVAKLPMIPALKATIAHCLGDEAWLAVRPPLVALDAGQRAELAAILADQGFAMPGIDARHQINRRSTS
ncbi:4-hydroxy-tetrahydrodipicolinate synthase [Tepidamorphus gemmatus]|uniref:4-hydroxy-tetrahydrodipicolinate synthase n=1 Tax=Tepidamorphus gemmatus TaxID=747076 RepID=A0A4R3MCU9_9HYPH|nr:dihydrodipicolinate synthase family protein [Tepidamorphus gemmatus]TCT10703.1 4-hydroxy-tetrahydrodipicolinate synthase [Tepidamorphus gemmatus]